MSKQKILVTLGLAMATMALSTSAYAVSGKEARPLAEKIRDAREAIHRNEDAEFKRVMTQPKNNASQATSSATSVAIAAAKKSITGEYREAFDFVKELSMGKSEGEVALAGAAARLITATEGEAMRLGVKLDKSSNIDDAIKSETDAARLAELKVLAAMDTSVKFLETYMTSKAVEGRESFLTLLVKADQGAGVTAASFKESFSKMIEELVNCR